MVFSFTIFVRKLKFLENCFILWNSCSSTKLTTYNLSLTLGDQIAPKKSSKNNRHWRNNRLQKNEKYRCNQIDHIIDSLSKYWNWIDYPYRFGGSNRCVTLNRRRLPLTEFTIPVIVTVFGSNSCNSLFICRSGLAASALSPQLGLCTKMLTLESWCIPVVLGGVLILRTLPNR